MIAYEGNGRRLSLSKVALSSDSIALTSFVKSNIILNEY